MDAKISIYEVDDIHNIDNFSNFIIYDANEEKLRRLAKFCSHVTSLELYASYHDCTIGANDSSLLCFPLLKKLILHCLIITNAVANKLRAQGVNIISLSE